MAILSGNVIGNMKGKLGNLSARTVDGRTIMAARPSSFNASQDPASLEVRAKFAVTANFAKNVLSLATLEEIWTKVKASGMSVFNTVFKNNFGFSSTDKPTEQNILAPEGFPLQISTAAVETNKITGTLPALNTASVFGADEVNLSANALVCFYDPTSENDEPFQIISLSKEVANFNFTQTYSLQIDYNVLQEAVAAKYQHSILYLIVASKSVDGKVVQNSSTYTKLS
ncbi:MAG: hypothetical protein M1480_17505 [Bacteroidetes bacterium]|nr:hypothetical protein [Bacteroidota bacterium]